MSLTVWANYLGASERFYLVLSGNSMDYWILMGISKMSTLENAGFQYFFCWVNSNPKVYHSWKNSGNSIGFFTCIFPNRLFFLLFFFLFFLLPSLEKTTISYFEHFNDDNFGSKYDNKTNYPIFFSISPLSSIHCYIYFLNFKTLKIQFHGLPLLHYVLLYKIHFMPKIIF